MRLIRLGLLPPLEILDVPLVVPLRVVDLGGCWGLDSGFSEGISTEWHPYTPFYPTSRVRDR